MSHQENASPTSPSYTPTMAEDYSRISDTARAVNARVLPDMMSYIQSIAPRIAAMDSEAPFVIADYGTADGVNSSELFEKIIRQIRFINPSLNIRLIYIDIADEIYFENFWTGSKLAQIENVEAAYIRRSFYKPFPELAGRLHIGFSSTALHWLDTSTVDDDFFQHQSFIQANQLPAMDRGKFVEKWKYDWRVYFHECAVALVEGGALFLANLTNLGADHWPASPGYNNLCDVCNELYREGRISSEELNAIFVPDYFAAPKEMESLLGEEDLKRHFSLHTCDAMTVACAYFPEVKGNLDDHGERAQLAATLAHVVRAWSESSIKVGLSSNNKGMVEDIYQLLKDKFYESPKGLPYQYCLLELVKHGKLGA